MLSHCFRRPRCFGRIELGQGVEGTFEVKLLDGHGVVRLVTKVGCGVIRSIHRPIMTPPNDGMLH